MAPKAAAINKEGPNLTAFLAYLIAKKVSVSQLFQTLASIALKYKYQINWKEVAALYNAASGENITGNAMELRFRDIRKKARTILPAVS
jgi:hypothetical protein